MNKAFEKILERLDDGVSLPKMNGMERRVGKRQTQGFGIGVLFAKEIVKEVAKEYMDGWIPCSERLPEKNIRVLTTHKNGIVQIAYLSDSGNFIIEDDGDKYVIQVIAWQPLPEPFKERD